MSRAQQDTFIDDDEEETCPLCVEEFDLSDRNFRPCPCGYQICQFCYNNIKTTMNGLCPACRRPYDDKNIEWKMISPEEMANYKADLAQQQKKKAAARQKEAQKREADSLGRKHLAGLRVVQKNLVYVTGLSPTIREDQLLQTLRGDQYFGQYGKIIKIVVSKAKETSHGQHSVGVYVTFARKEDAASCIAAVDGSQNGDRTLRAQYGTTKYCSIYLRGEQCSNRNCMFLHEPGEENDSFTRQDLSSMNVISTQQPAQSQMSSTSSQPPQPQPPPQRAPQKVVAATQPMQRSESREVAPSPAESGDGSALPSTASWADQKSLTQPNPKTSAARSADAFTISASNVQPSSQPSEAQKLKSAVPILPAKDKSIAPTPVPLQHPKSSARSSSPTRPKQPTIWNSLVRAVASPDFRFSFSSDRINEDDLKIIMNFPLLFDPNGGGNRRLRTERAQEEALRMRESLTDSRGEGSSEDLEENPEGGSYQLGGEPDDRQRPVTAREQQRQAAIRPPSQQSIGPFSFPFGQNLPHSAELSHNALSLQQNQQNLLQQFKSPTPQASNSFGQARIDQVHVPQSGTFPGSFQQPGGAVHTRQMSRFSFANDTASASAAVKPVANTKLMSQQSSMMPPINSGQFNSMTQHQQLGSHFYSSGVHGPPPGLKATGTPPVTGGGMFAQGHGFTTGGLGFGGNAASRNTNDELMREFMRNRGANVVGGQMPDAAKLDVADQSILQARLHQGGLTTGQGYYGGQGQGGFNSMMYGGGGGAHENQVTQGHETLLRKREGPSRPSSSDAPLTGLAETLPEGRRSTPAVPPGLPLPHGHPPVPGSQEPHVGQRDPISRPLSALIPAVPTPLTTTSRPSAHLQTPQIAYASPGVEDAKTECERLPDLKAEAINATITEEQARKTPETLHSGMTNAVVTNDARRPEKHLTTERTGDTLVSGTGTSKFTAHAEAIVSDASSTAVQKPTVKSADQAKLEPESSQTGSKKDRDTENYASDSRIEETIRSGISNRPKSIVLEPRTNEARATSSTKTGKDSPTQSSKRQHPGKLDIAAVVKSEPQLLRDESTKMQTPTDNQPRTVQTPSAPSLASRPSTPVIGADSPAKRQQPRTLRVVATPKAETPLIENPSSTPSGAPPGLAVVKTFSRQPSVASFQPPGTPASEVVSDNVSLASASISRGGSPLPTKLGTTPVRTKTKSQLKKERQEQAKVLEEGKATEDEKASTVEETVQEPIIGRKKKTKKPTGDSSRGITPTPSRPISPMPRVTDKVADQIASETPAKPSNDRKVNVSDAKAGEAAAETRTSSPKAELTAVSLFAELQRTEELFATALEFFKPLSGLASRHDINQADVAKWAKQPALEEADKLRLSAGEPVRKGGSGDRTSSRVLISPSRLVLRGLTEEQEGKFLELERRLIGDKSPFRFMPRKATAAILRAAARANPLFNDPLPKSDQSAVPRVDVDETLQFLNQPIIPTPSGAVPQIEKFEPIDDTASDDAAAAAAVQNLGMWDDVTYGNENVAAPRLTGQSMQDLEFMFTQQKKEAEGLEKKLNALIKKNRRLAFGAGN